MGLIDRLDDWFFAEQRVHALALTRIIFGVALFVTYLCYSPYLEWYWGSDGLLPYIFNLKPPYTLTQTALWPIFGALMLSALCFTVGLFTRIAGLLLLAGHFCFIRWGVLHTWGWAETMPLLLLYVSLSGAGRWLSVDAWWAARQGRPISPTASRWALRLVQIHVCMIYVAAGWHRIDDGGWLRGEMVYEAMSNTWYTRLPLVDFQPYKAVMAWATWGTEFLELLAPVALWLRPTRKIWMIGLIAMHTGLHLGASVGMWQPMMVGSLLSFADPQSVEGLASWLRRRIWARLQPTTTPS